mgnify:CR=1 FL=1
MSVRKSVDPTATREEESNTRIDEDYFRIVRSLGDQLITPSSEVALIKKDLGAAYVPAGSYGGAVVSGTRQSILCAPGAKFTKQVVVRGFAMIKNATLLCEGNTPAIVVEAGGSLLLSGCLVSKGDAPTDRYITVQTGGYATVSNCAFFGDQGATGTVITNEDAGNPQRVAVVGCMNLTTIIAATRYTNVTFVQDVAVP